MDVKEIRDKEFPRRFRGYDPQEVESFVGRLADYIADLHRELDNVSDQLRQTNVDLKEYRVREKTLEANLTQTRRISDEMRANSEKEAKFIVAEAELQAEKILNQAHNRLAQIHDDITELKRQRAQFEVRLRSLVEAHLKLLEVEADRDRDLSELEDKIKILRSPST
ncbi:MAG: DivIVA domain-containing protein [Proteobacteria bacterium]|nr:DivIVA domain-containing protein [Pseudomonadota bacterium]MBU1450193.1 DivIVA domain-containing protein [Pseudomonadota bacterium]MBU2468591.1 DivIVA domain-containing protein [Pseudomonadota bacterium]MBU2517290.1 DivIVA domain-containing protein [Pseudomonadota bacterium]